MGGEGGDGALSVQDRTPASGRSGGSVAGGPGQTRCLRSMWLRMQLKSFPQLPRGSGLSSPETQGGKVVAQPSTQG